MDSEKHERDIADWISQPRKPPSINKDEEAESKEEDVGATEASTEDSSPIDKYEEVFEYDRKDDRKYTVLSDAKNTKEEASSRHKGESLLLDSSDRSDDNNDDDNNNNRMYDNAL